MTTITVTAAGDVPAFRFLAVAEPGDPPALRAAAAGDVPVGTTSRDPIADGAPFSFTVSGAAVWRVEAGEQLLPGQFVAAGDGGRAVVAGGGDYRIAVALEAVGEGQVAAVAPLRGAPAAPTALGEAKAMPFPASSASKVAEAVSDLNALITALKELGILTEPEGSEEPAG